MIVFGIHCNFFIVLPIRLKTCSFNGFFNFYKAKCACQKNQEGLRGFALPTAPDWHLARNFSRLDFASITLRLEMMRKFGNGPRQK